MKPGSASKVWKQPPVVVFVGEGAPTLLGAYTLEGALLMVDPVRQQLAPTHALRMANLIEFIDSEVPQH